MKKETHNNILSPYIRINSNNYNMRETVSNPRKGYLANYHINTNRDSALLKDMVKSEKIQMQKSCYILCV